MDKSNRDSHTSTKYKIDIQKVSQLISHLLSDGTGQAKWATEAV